MIINLKLSKIDELKLREVMKKYLSKVDEAKMREVMKKQRRPFTQNDVKRFFLDQLNRAYVS